MSRSYRKPYRTDQQGGRGRAKWAKRYANKVVRRTEDVPNGKKYRRVTCSWNIRDWSFYEDSKPTTYWSAWKGEFVTEVFTPRWKAIRK